MSETVFTDCPVCGATMSEPNSFEHMAIDTKSPARQAALTWLAHTILTNDVENSNHAREILALMAELNALNPPLPNPLDPQ